jgi:hypothetical protein
MVKKSFLDYIQSPLPCSKEWDEMVGDENVRFCEGCRKNVYNLSAMPRREASKFVARNSGKVCVRYVRLTDGKVQTADTKLYKITRRASQLAAGMFGATLTLSAIANAQTPEKPKPAPAKTVRTQNKNNSETSQISFTVSDATGAGIPNAEIRLTNPQTNEEFTALTNEDGTANLDFIPPGRYEVKAAANGFQPFKRVFQIKERVEPNIKIYLEVGAVVGVFIIREYEIPLFEAIAQKDNEVVKKMITSGFDVNTKNRGGLTALHVAVENENLEIIRFLLNRGANVNAKTKSRRTPIMMIEGGDEENALEIFKLLTEKGADVNVLNEDKETPLMVACEDDNLELVKILLEAGANPNLKNEDGETAMQLTDSDEIKELLKKYGAKE